MDAMGLGSLTGRVVATAVAAVTSVNTLYSRLRDFKDEPKAFRELHTELGALSKVLEALHMNLNSSLNHITKDQQQMLQECHQLLEACKMVCDDAELGDIVQHWTSWDEMNRSVEPQPRIRALSDAAVKLRIWKMGLGLVVHVIQFKPDKDDKNNAHKVAIEDVQRTISKELEQVNSELKSAGEGPRGSPKTTDTIAQQTLLPLKVRQDALSQTLKMCETAAETLQKKQMPDITKDITAQPSVQKSSLVFTSEQQARTALVTNSRSVQHFGAMNGSDFRKVMGLRDDEDFV
ncbi:hypothetical protein V8C34DRAFT_287618 [Trichoderma compactum]